MATFSPKQIVIVVAIMQTIDRLVCYKIIADAIKPCASLNTTCVWNEEKKMCVRHAIKKTSVRKETDECLLETGANDTFCKLAECDRKCENRTVWETPCYLCGLNRTRSVLKIVAKLLENETRCEKMPQLETLACPSFPCYDEGDASLVYDEWGDWSPCLPKICKGEVNKKCKPISCGHGERRRRRQPIANMATPNKSLNDAAQIAKCSNYTECPCQVRYSEWSECTSNDETSNADLELCGGRGFRNRSVVRNEWPANMTECGQTAAVETATCPDLPCKVNCSYGDWGEWSPCSVTCGKGTTYRHRAILSQALYGGEECPNEIESESSQRNQNECFGMYSECPVNCVWSNWDEWSSCPRCIPHGKKITAFNRTRHRREEPPASTYGDKCVGHSKESQPCETSRRCKQIATADESSNDVLLGDKPFCYIVAGLAGFVLLVAALSGICIFCTKNRRRRSSLK